MPKRFCQDCRSLFDMDTTGTLRCPACQATATAARNARTSTTGRGYGSQHQRIREQLLEQFTEGDPCAICGRPMVGKRGLDLAHNEDRSGYRGLSHASCNRATNTGR